MGKTQNRRRGRAYDRLFPQTDVGAGERFRYRWGHVARYVPAMRTWLVRDGVHWRPDDNGQAIRWAVETLRYARERDPEFLLEKWAIPNFEATADDQDADVKPCEAAPGPPLLDAYDRKKRAQKDRNKLEFWLDKMESMGKVRSMLEAAGTAPGVSVPMEVLDADPWLLGVENGTLDLRTGEVRAPRDGEFVTKCAKAPYDPKAEAPEWDAMLERVMPDPEAREFLQRAIGYSLIGEQLEQVLIVCHGDGANGKSTVLNTVKHLMGPYARNADHGTIVNRSDGKHREDIARLAGARFVTTIETEAGKALSEGIVKSMTGRDTITANFMRQDSFEFEPRFTIWMAVNDLPTVDGFDYGIWRRLKLISFPVKLTPSEIDVTLPDRLRQRELAGILRWAVDGVQMYRDKGLEPPMSVLEDTSVWQKENAGQVQEFLEDVFDGRKEERVFVPNETLNHALRVWWQAQGFDAHDIPSAVAFGKRLTKITGQKATKESGGVRGRHLPPIKAEWTQRMNEPVVRNREVRQ